MREAPSPETLAWLRQSAALDGAVVSQVLLHLLERVEALEQRPIPGLVLNCYLDGPPPAPHASFSDWFREEGSKGILVGLRISALPSRVGSTLPTPSRPTPEAAPVATDEELLKVWDLGVVTTTERGFELIEFLDCYDKPCSLQQSSLAIYQTPGTSAIWLGQGDDRMHLKEDQVKALITHLQRWLDDGSFRAAQPAPPVAPADCPACEGMPSAFNNPCCVCGLSRPAQPASPAAPADEELEATARAAEIQYTKKHGGLNAFTPDGIHAQLQAQRLAGLRAVLARWGNAIPLPKAGEVPNV